MPRVWQSGDNGEATKAGHPQQIVQFRNARGSDVKFRGEVFRSGKTTTGIYVPPEVMTELASGKRPAVNITINDFTYRNTVGGWEGRPVLSVSAEVRTKAGIAAGDEVEVTLELDTEPREVTVPPDLAAALAEDPAVQQRFDALSYSKKRGIVLPIEDAKTDETRQRRIEKAVAMLREGA